MRLKAQQQTSTKQFKEILHFQDLNILKRKKDFLVYPVELVKKAFQRAIFQYINSLNEELLIQKVKANYNLVALETKAFFMNNSNHFEDSLFSMSLILNI